MTRELVAAFLENVTVRVLEQAAFLFAQPAPGNPPLAGELIEARVRLWGADVEEFRLAVTPALAQEIAANMLGLEPGSGEARESADGAVGELLNVLAGALSRHLLGPRTQCRLGAPTVARGAARPAEPTAITVVLRVEGADPLQIMALVRTAEEPAGVEE